MRLTINKKDQKGWYIAVMKPFLLSLHSRYVIVALLLFAGACEMPASTPTAGSARGFALIWYVAATGNDGNVCDSPDTPCRTIAGVFRKAEAENARLAATYPDLYTVHHTINVGPGTFHEMGPRAGYPLANVTYGLTFIGAGQTATIIDLDGTYGGFFIHEDSRTTLRGFTIQNVNGTAPDSCINIRDEAVVTLENVNIRRCVRNGISNISTGLLTLNNVNSSENIDDGTGNGKGLSNLGDAVVTGGSFSDNEGGGIGSRGTIFMNFVQVQRNGRDGVAISGTGTLSEVNMSENGQDGSFRSGLHVEGGSITVEHSTFLNNQFGIQIASGSLRVTDSLISGNPRTGIQIGGGELHLVNSDVENNAATYAETSLGGGMHIESSGLAIVTASRFSGNENGGIANYGELRLTGSSISGNNGGLPALFNASEATGIILRSLIANNTRAGSVVTGEHAIDNRGDLSFVNSTVSGNDGDGISSSGVLGLSYVTIASNEGFGLLISESGTTPPTIGNTIVAGNGTDCYVPGPSGPGAAFLVGRNIDSDDSCDFPETESASSLLAPLTDNGGGTLTHALVTGSPALDAASGSCPTDDQRAVRRPFGPACDVGAYESDSASALSLDTDLGLATVTPTSGLIQVIITISARCRTGPGLVYNDYDFFNAGDQSTVHGRSADNNWYYTQALNLNGKCWIGKGVLEFDVSPEVLLTLPVLQPPATPTLTGAAGDDGGGAPAAPSNLQANETACNANEYVVSLSWKDNSGNEQGFRIYHNGQLIITVGPNVAKYDHSVSPNLPWGQQQSYFVRAYNGAGESQSNTKTEDGCLY